VGTSCAALCSSGQQLCGCSSCCDPTSQFCGPNGQCVSGQ
jgi:hypothetical protein